MFLFIHFIYSSYLSNSTMAMLSMLTMAEVTGKFLSTTYYVDNFDSLVTFQFVASY